jgi:hypothetical protein
VKKALTALTAVSALTLAASANAALVSFDLTEQQYDVDWATAVGNYTGTGSGTLDTDTGVFNYNLHVDWLNQYFHTAVGQPNAVNQYPTNAHWDWVGSIQTGASPSGTYTTVGCSVDSGAGFYAAPVCASAVLAINVSQDMEGGWEFFGANGPGDWDPVNPLVFDTTPGASTDFAGLNTNGNRINYYTVTAASAPVPVPAAVWLFGTGLAGLAGLAKKRRASSEA